MTLTRSEKRSSSVIWASVSRARSLAVTPGSYPSEGEVI
jgi:hypothetical protein